MTDSVVADRYAQALVGTISDLNELDRIDAEINLVGKLLETDVTFKRFFLSPRVPQSDKKALIRKVFSELICADVLHLIYLIIDKHRENITTKIAKRFSALADELKGVEAGTVITAVEMHDDEFKLLEAKVQKFSGRKITLEREVDPSLIGGIILWLGNHVIDGSIRYRLDCIRRDLLEVKTHLPSKEIAS